MTENIMNASSQSPAIKKTEDAAIHITLASEIRGLRGDGKLPDAILRCKEAIQLLPKDPFFSKVLADLYFEKGEYEAAFIALADFLGKIRPIPPLLAEFAKRYHRFKRVLPSTKLNEYASLLNSSIEQANLHPQLAKRAKEIIGADAIPKSPSIIDSPSANEFIRHFETGDVPKLARTAKNLENQDAQQFLTLLDTVVLNQKRSEKNFQAALFCVSLYEKFQKYDRAIKILSEIIKIRIDSVAVRTLFRICRLVKNYDIVDDLLTQKPAILNANDFNVLYELVYYFEAKNDVDQLKKVLNTIDRSFAQNLPVLRTLRNFYIRFGMVDDARRLEPIIFKLYKKKNETESGKFASAIAESETEMASKVQELYSQLEHQTQLAAISDLTTGISHELGQPITNIRYTIQFYKRLFEKKNATKEGIESIFQSILEETERMGALISRLSPLTTGKSVIEVIDIVDRIKKRINAEKPRLTATKIQVSISPQSQIYVNTDPVKFDQLISNLVLNAIDAIVEKKENAPSRKIDIQLEDSGNEVKIYFADSGVGIPIAHRNTIFDPFFTTKPPGKGEGLGLFIVWNLLKMQGGRITVDPKYMRGARFVITLPKRTS